MLADWKQRIFSRWTMMRFIRLGFGLMILVQWFENSELIFALLAGILLFQAIFNFGCGSSGCGINEKETGRNVSPEDLKDVTYTEVE